LNLITFIFLFYHFCLFYAFGLVLFYLFIHVYSLFYLILIYFLFVCISLGWQAGAGSHAAHGACGGV